MENAVALLVSRGEDTSGIQEAPSIGERPPSALRLLCHWLHGVEWDTLSGETQGLG